MNLYDRTCKRSGVQSDDKMGKNVSAEALAAKLRVALSGGSGRFTDNAIVPKVFASDASGSDMRRLLGSGGGDESAFSGGSMLEPDMDELLARSVKKTRKEEQEEEEPDEADEDDAEPKEPKTGWFDADIRVNAAYRRYEKASAKLRATLEGTQAKMQSSMNDVPPVYQSRLNSELAVVTRRHAWLAATLALDEGRSLTSLKEQVKEAAKQVPNDKSSNSGSTSSQFSRCGPCPGFEELVPMSVIEAHKMTLKAAKNEEEMKTRETAMDSHKKLLNVLCSSCKTAVTDLVSAVTAFKAEAEEKRKAEEEEAIKVSWF